MADFIQFLPAGRSNRTVPADEAISFGFNLNFCIFAAL